MDLEYLVPFSVLGTIGVTMYYLTKTMTDYSLKKRMISNGLVGEEAAKILASQQSSSNKYASLKWGLIILFGGIGMIIVDPIIEQNDSTTMPIGILGISISLGFLVYYFIVKKFNQEND